MTLSLRDQADLGKYYALGYMEKSTAGPTLERAWLYAIESSVVEPEGGYTARPTAEVRIAAKGEPHLDDLELIGRVSRKLAMLSARHRKALESFHGDRGSRCAVQVEKHGRIVSLFEMTSAGRALAKRERLATGKTRLKTTNAELIENAIGKHDKAVDAAKEGTAIETSSTIGQALKQAHELKEGAEDAYTAASERVAAERKKIPAPPPKLTSVAREMRDEEL